MKIKLKCHGKEILENMSNMEMIDLARKIDISYTHLNDIFSDRYNDVGLTKAYKIAWGLGLKIDDV